MRRWWWLTLASCALSSVAAARPADDRRPNVVFMLADNLGYGELGSYGGGILRGAPTPRLDALGAEGLRLLNFNVESQCTPSRSALLTGRFAIRSGTTKVARGGAPSGLVQWEVTLAELLSGRGYATGHFGKWHLGGGAGRLPTDQGFDEWYGITGTSHTSLWPTAVGFDPQVAPPTRIFEGRKGAPSRAVGTFDLPARRLIDGEITRRAIDFISRRAKEDRPFFAYVPFTQVHYPTLPHPDFAGKTGHGDLADALVELDHNAGRILDAVQALGLEERTIVVFASDNGPEDLLPWRGLAGPWSGSYFTAMEGSLRAPFMIRWPKRIPGGRVSNEIVHGVDVFTTLARLAGAAVPADRIIDGVDQSEFFAGKQQTSARQGFPCYVGDTLFAVKWRNWKVHFVWQERKFDAPQVLSTPRLFHLIDDPREQNDLGMGAHAWVLYATTKIVNDLQASFKREPPIPPGAPDPYTRRR